MDIYKIAQIIEEFAPLELAEPWDFCGHLVECVSRCSPASYCESDTNRANPTKRRCDETKCRSEAICDCTGAGKAEVKKVMLALTVTDDVVAQARENNCDMIISHHPLFCVPIDYKNIPIYCAHTNLDQTQGGTTDTLIKTLGLEKTICHCEQSEAIQSFARYVEFKNSMTIDAFVQRLKNISNNVRLVNNKGASTIKKIAFCAGSGSDFIEEATEAGADAFVTGDLKFHTALDSRIVLFDVGHFESEIPVLKVLENLLKGKVEVVFADESSPFLTC